MKILLVSSQDYIHHPIPSRHHYIFERLAERHEVHVAHFHISNNKERLTKLKVEECTAYPFKNLIMHYTLNSPYHLYKFNQIIQKNDIDVVVAAHVLAGTAAILAAKHNDIPLLFDLKDWFPDSAAAYFKNPLLKKIVHDSVFEVTKYNLKNSTKITTVSPNLISKIKNLGCESQLITNGVDTSIFKPSSSDSMRKSLKISDSDFVIGFAGSLERWYDIDLLVSFIKHHKEDNIKLLLVGGSLFTGYNKEIEDEIKKLQISDKVIHIGLVNYSNLPSFINCMDVCTIPLIPTDWKNIALPNKFFEYTACGKPILTTPIPNVIDFKSPNVYVYKSYSDFEEKILVMRNAKLRFDIDFSKHDWNCKANEMEKVLFSLIK